MRRVLELVLSYLKLASLASGSRRWIEGGGGKGGMYSCAHA